MSIFQKIQQQESISEGSRALELFTDRYNFTRLFLRYVNEEPAQGRILFLHGEGGSGKSLLLRYLGDSVCKRLRLQDYNWATNLPDEQMVTYLKQAQSTQRVPSAYLDFGMPPRGDDRPQQAFYALLMLRRSLGAQGLQFPLYDFATIWYMNSKGWADPGHVKALFPTEEVDFITTLIDTLSSTPVGTISKAVLALFNKRAQVDRRFTMYMHRRNLSQEQVTNIQRMDPDKELLGELPKFFAEDLNTMLLREESKRIVLFFDTHEAFWGQKYQEQEMSDYVYFERDEWLRCLVSTLHLQSGAVVVVAGRVPPRWAQAPRCTVPDQFLDLQLLGNLPEEYALSYLEQAGITDHKVRQLLADATAVEPRQSHPLFLSLGADMVLAIQARRGHIPIESLVSGRSLADKGQTFMDLLLRHVDEETEYAIRALSATRAFNRYLYFRLGEGLRFRVSDATFRSLVQFSFVWRAPHHGEGWFRIHPLLRRIVQQREDEVAKGASNVLNEADDMLEAYYRSRASAGEDLLLAEAIYHRSRQDWEAGIDEWTEVFVDSFHVGNLPLCQSLMEVRPEMRVETNSWRAFVAYLEAQYLDLIAHYDEAKGRYQEAFLLSDDALKDDADSRWALVLRAKMLRSYAQLLIDLSDIEGAFTLLDEAETWVERALDESPGYDYALQARITIYDTRMQLQSRLGRYEAVADTYERLAPVLTEIAHNDSAVSTALIDRALALCTLAEAQARQAQFAEARGNCEQALSYVDQALIQSSPDEQERAFYAQGFVHLRLGEIERQLSNLDAAEEHYLNAISRFESILAGKQADLETQKFLGVALMGLGAIQAQAGKLDEATNLYTRGRDCFGSIMEVAPDHAEARVNKLLALAAIGRVLVMQNRPQEASRVYQQVVDTAESILRYEPHNGFAHANKAAALVGLGEVYAAMADDMKAAECFELAVASYDKSTENLDLNPEASLAKSVALSRLGDYYASESRLSEAFRYYEKAILACDEAVKGMPNTFQARFNKVGCLLRMGEMRVRRFQRDRACRCFSQALQDAEGILPVAPDENRAAIVEMIDYLRLALREYCGV